MNEIIECTLNKTIKSFNLTYFIIQLCQMGHGDCKKYFPTQTLGRGPLIDVKKFKKS